MLSPFPYFGGKRTIAREVWTRLGAPAHYIEPFCGSAAMLLACPSPASLEVIGDGSGFIANFWRATKHQPAAVAQWADYPVSHIDLGARHVWLMAQRDRIGQELQDPHWTGDANVAGWWLWGQCCWIGSGWCNWFGQIPHAGNAGQGVQALGQIPHAGNAGQGELLTSCGRTAWIWLHQLADRLERVRVVHGEWSRCLNHHYGGDDTAIFLDPPYRSFESVYQHATPVADEVEAWAREHGHLKIALCGHEGDYQLDDWDTVAWSRGKFTYGGSTTTDNEMVWYSPACLPADQPRLF